MVFTLHRYIFKELIRIFASTAVAMTIVLSFAMLLRPVQENGISPSQAITLLGYFVPITLTFVLPMAALFATALIYGRFASDNELDACRASGISITTTLYPAICLAFLVAIATLILNFHVVPAFVHRAERMVRDNAKQILFRNIQRKGYYRLPQGGYRIYADKVIPSQDILEGVAIIRLEDNEITRLMSAKAAKVLIDKQNKQNRVRIIAEEFYVLDEASQAYVSKLPIEEFVESGLSEEIMFQKIDQIKKIQADMVNYPPIRKIAEEARARLVVDMLAEDINATISKTSEDERYYTLENEERKIMFTASGCVVDDVRQIKLLPPVNLIELDAIKGSLLLKWATNSSAKIKLDGIDLDKGLTVAMQNAAWESATGLRNLAPAPNRVYRQMRIPGDIADKTNSAGIIEQVLAVGTDRSFLTKPASDYLCNIQAELARKMWVTSKEIDAEIHSRLVFGIGCIALVFISSALGIMYKGSHMLSAFGASAVPAGALIVFTMSGKQLATTSSSDLPENAGVMVMWAGFVVVTIFAVWIYRKLTRT